MRGPMCAPDKMTIVETSSSVQPLLFQLLNANQKVPQQTFANLAYFIPQAAAHLTMSNRQVDGSLLDDRLRHSSISRARPYFAMPERSFQTDSAVSTSCLNIYTSTLSTQQSEISKREFLPRFVCARKPTAHILRHA